MPSKSQSASHQTVKGGGQNTKPDRAPGGPLTGRVPPYVLANLLHADPEEALPSTDGTVSKPDWLNQIRGKLQLHAPETGVLDGLGALGLEGVEVRPPGIVTRPIGDRRRVLCPHRHRRRVRPARFGVQGRQGASAQETGKRQPEAATGRPLSRMPRKVEHAK